MSNKVLQDKKTVSKLDELFVFPEDLDKIGGKDEWIIRPFFPLGCLLELKGQQKTAGKSTWLFHAIRSITTGEPFLGHTPDLLSDVVYLSEQPARSLLPALKGAGLDTSKRLHLWLLTQHSTKKWSTTIGHAVARCIEKGAKLLVIDTLSNFALALEGLDENDAGTAYKILLPLQRALKYGITVVIVRHERKGGGSVAAAGRGSTAIAGAVDGLLSMRAPVGQRLPDTVREIRTLSRFDEIPEKMLVELKDGVYTQFGQDDSGEADETVDLTPFLPGTLNEIVERSGLPRTTVWRLVKRYKTRGGGKKGDPTIYLAN